MVVSVTCSTMKYPKRSQYKHAKKKRYRVRNWAEYNAALCRRGDLTIWFHEDAILKWKARRTGKRGGQPVSIEHRPDFDSRTILGGQCMTQKFTAEPYVWFWQLAYSDC